MRKLEDVLDADLVDIVAIYGVGGTPDLDDWDVCCDIAALLKISDFEIPDEDEQTRRLCFRLGACIGLEKIDAYGTYWRLTPEEWGRRLEGKSAAEIATALKGSAS